MCLVLEGTSSILTKERYYYTRPQQNMLRCEEVGHISWQCETMDEPMPTAESSIGQQAYSFAALVGNSGFQKVICPTGAVHPFEDTTDKNISVPPTN